MAKATTKSATATKTTNPPPATTEGPKTTNEGTQPKTSTQSPETDTETAESIRKKLADALRELAEFRKENESLRSAVVPPHTQFKSAVETPPEDREIVTVRVLGRRPIYEGIIRHPGTTFATSRARLRALGDTVEEVPAGTGDNG
jgi:hypothetical protein